MNKTRFNSLTAGFGLAIAFTLLCLAATAFAQTPITDPRDGKAYKTAKIGEQVWLAENLNYNAEGSKCFNLKPEYCEKYGRLYNWDMAIKSCPSGWHLPSKGEYEALDKAVGGKDVAARKLKAKSGWFKDGNGTDDYGFSALPGGDLGGVCPPGGAFSGEGFTGTWWSIGEDNSSAYYRYITCNDEVVFGLTSEKSYMHSVRCVKDKPQGGTK